MGDWSIVRLGELASDERGSITIGPFGSRMKSDVYTASGVPIIRGTNISSTRAWKGDWVYVSDDFADGLPNCNVHEGDLVFPHRGSIGEVAIIPGDRPRYMLSTSLMKFRPDREKVLPLFLFYYFRSASGRTEIMRYSSQVGTPGIGQPLTSLRQFQVPVPSREIQERVAGTLAALDDKIEVNRRMNETLESMARSIFKDWFVDFGPTRAKAEGHEPYLSAELWDLFPDAFDEEDKPMGWTRERIGIHVVATKGLSYKGAGLTDAANGIPLHNLNSVLEGGGYKNDGLKFYSGDYKPRHMAKPGDLIAANTEQGFKHLLIGYSALIPKWVGKEGLISHHTFKVEPRPGSPLSRVWLHFALSVSSFGEAVRRFSNGTTVNMLPQDAFEIPELVVPPEGLVRAFEGFIGPKLRKQEQAFGESQALAVTRDLLLPKLMSGEIHVSEAENAVETVA